MANNDNTTFDRARNDANRQTEQKFTVNELLAALGPILDSIALTPEKIELLKKPYIDPVETARQKRHRQEMARDIANGLKMQAEMQARCPHGHGGPDGAGYKLMISLVDNHPDGHVRGRCNMCNKLIQPAHWEIAADGTPIIINADIEYQKVLELDAMSVSAYAY